MGVGDEMGVFWYVSEVIRLLQWQASQIESVRPFLSTRPKPLSTREWDARRTNRVSEHTQGQNGKEDREADRHSEARICMKEQGQALVCDRTLLVHATPLICPLHTTPGARC